MILTTLAILPSIAAVVTTAQVVDLGYASYQGTFNATTGNTVFLGIRYAAPPTGSQRWQLPRIPDTVTGVIQANVEPPGCPAAGDGISPINPQPHGLATRAIATTSEDCLFLNVFTPQLTSAAETAKPVVVWIHGGGYQAGSAAGFSGEDLIREANGGVVAVVIQYRLGVYGFLAGKEVKSEGVLNAGLLDQEFALQWVQTNIAKFGGDPAQVTIWGESAGAGSVLQHVIAHDGKTSPPLFRAAITSSTFLPSQYAFDDIIPQTLYNEVVSQASCASAADTLACLRTVDTTTLQNINVNLSTSAFFGTFIFIPVVDGSFITQRPTLAMKEHKVNGEALLAVTNAFEGFIFVDQSTAGTVTTPEYVSQLFPKLGAQEIAEATAQYADLGAPIDQANAIQGEGIICQT
ncbi:hypothetical protein C0989_008867 [Termitomyces sp. Mn162]|nr:hypothetical protein C0989_008867 [Termitomyces sp. Mn162]